MINIHGGEEPSPESPTAFVYTKTCAIVPFIGVKIRTDGSRERVVGVNCPNRKKAVYQSVDSADPLVYLRAYKMLSELKVITDELVQTCIQDCIIATQVGSRLGNFAKTSVYMKHGIYKQSAFEDAQKKAFAFIPSKELIQRIIAGFEKHGAPLNKEDDPPGLPIIATAPSPFVLAPEDTSNPVSKIEPAKTGHFYKLLPAPQAQTA